MASFRNMLVHHYEKVEDEVVFGIFKNKLEDFDLFREFVPAYLRRDKNAPERNNRAWPRHVYLLYSICMVFLCLTRTDSSSVRASSSKHSSSLPARAFSSIQCSSPNLPSLPNEIFTPLNVCPVESFFYSTGAFASIQLGRSPFHPGGISHISWKSRECFTNSLPRTVSDRKSYISCKTI